MIDNVADPGSAEAMSFDEFAKLHIVDRRAFHKPRFHFKGEPKPREYEPRKRTKLTGICFHQTACWMGLKVERYDTIGAHWTQLPNGLFLRHRDDDREVIHAHGWNARCTGIEVMGLYSGLPDDPTTLPREDLRTTWNSPSTPERDEPMEYHAESARLLRMWTRWMIINAARQYGAKIEFLVAHRQASGDRDADPGWAIWSSAVVPVQRELGLGHGGVGFKIGDGSPIPTAWDPEQLRLGGKPIPYR